ncbi:MAG: hypothetical protein JSS20_12465 [Proteobacteria bacterium]|nr:hypothetical protein [Pseudomonadota bacterium]
MTHSNPRFIQGAGVRNAIDEAFSFAPDERVGAPLASRRGRAVRRAVLLAAVGSAGAGVCWYPEGAEQLWTGLVEFAASLPATLPEQTARAGSASSPLPAPSVAKIVRPAPEMEQNRLTAAPPAQAPISPTDLVAAPPAASPAAEPQATATLAETPPDAPPPPAWVDPLQKRAESVGLHPDISPAILKRLSETDWRNAGIAIRKALAETPDNAVLVSPPKRDAGRAQFRIEFVPGGAASCRRYVVTIARDGWASTALPVEKCGVKAPASRQASTAGTATRR